MKKSSRLMVVSVIAGLAACSSSARHQAHKRPDRSAGVRLKAKRYNSAAPRPDLAEMVAEIHRKYRGREVATRYAPGQREHDERGLREVRSWRFKTIQPIGRGRGSGGAYFYRFTLEVVRFRSAADAVRAMNRTLAAYGRQQEGDGKGDVSYRLLVRERIYTLDTGCLMNSILDRYYQLLVKHVLGGAGPEKHSLLRHHCGGGHALK